MPGRRRLALIVALTAAFVVPATAAWTYWSGLHDTLKGSGVAGATHVLAGSVPTAARAGGTSATVRWGVSTLANGRQVGGYRIRRYDSDTGVEQPVGSGCSGVLSTQICTEAGLPTGAWRYTVTPIFASSWTGPESNHSGAVAVGAATVTLDQRLFGAPLPVQATGSVTGFAPDEHISYTFGSADAYATLSGTPSIVDSDGNATITALTIPGVSDGPHTIHVVGADSGVHAEAGIVTDTTPPVVTAFVTPAPNAAGWNRTAVQVDGNADDGSGSGLSYVKATTDGSDPRTSPTAEYPTGGRQLDQTTTIKYYGVDLAGNAGDVVTLEVKIDMIPPTGAADMVEVAGGAIVEASGTLEVPGFAFYRGADPGSFRLRIAMTDTGGSGPASLGTSSVSGAGFTHIPGVSETETAGVYLTNPFSWVAGTTSAPTGSATMTDVAGNTTVIAGGLFNDSSAPTGGSVDATGLTGTGSRYSSSTSVTLALNRGIDVGSGLAGGGARLLRASAPLTAAGGVANGACGTNSAFAQVGADDPGVTAVDTVPTDDLCYRYSFAVPDKVGNVATSTSPDIKVQTAGPASLRPTIAVIVPVTGLVAQYVSGSTLYYKPLQTGSFTVSTSASDAWSGVANVGFPVLGGFSGGGGVTTPASGTTFKTTYNWSNNAASASPGAQTISATDNAGRSQSNTAAFSLVKDAGGPVHALSLTAATGAYLSGSTLWYRPNSSGSFKLVDTLTDDASGPASVSFPNLGLSGWTHASQTVSTPSGGPFTSSTFSWSPFPSSPGSYVVSGLDRLSTSSTTTITFSQDQSPPSGVSVSYPSGIVTALSVPLTLVNGTDGGSGLKAGSGIVRRDQATLNIYTNVCGSFANTFATTVTPVGGADTSVSTARCYKYRYLVSDNVGNQTTFTSSIVVKVKTG